MAKTGGKKEDLGDDYHKFKHVSGSMKNCPGFGADKRKNYKSRKILSNTTAKPQYHSVVASTSHRGCETISIDLLKRRDEKRRESIAV